MSSVDWECHETDARTVIRGADWRITVLRRGDRWIHGLSFGDLDRIDAEGHPLISSVETDRDGDDSTSVASPVYQEMHRHSAPQSGARSIQLLLTGKHFHHYFSAVLTVAADPVDPGVMVFDFDVADRCRGDVSNLAATYLVRLDSSALQTADQESIHWTGGPLGDGLLTFRVGSGGTPALAEAGRHSTRVQALARLQADSFTHLLRHQWRWATASGRTR